MTEKRLFYTNSHGPDPAARVAAAAKLLELAREQTPPVAMLALPTKSNLDNYDGAGFFPDAAMKSLKKSGAANISGVTVRLHTEHGRRPLPARGPVLALDSSPSLLSAVLADDNATAVVYVPWMESERDAFKQQNPSAVALT